MLSIMVDATRSHGSDALNCLPAGHSCQRPGLPVIVVLWLAEDCLRPSWLARLAHGSWLAALAHGSWLMGPGSLPWLKGPGSWVLTHGSWLMGPGSLPWLMGPGSLPWLMGPGSAWLAWVLAQLGSPGSWLTV